MNLLLCRWNPAYGVPGATDLFIRLMDALYTVNTNMLFLIQGPNQVNLTGLGGSSYVTNIPNADIPNNLDADPNAFFKQVLVKSYVSQVSTVLTADQNSSVDIAKNVHEFGHR